MPDPANATIAAPSAATTYARRLSRCQAVLGCLDDALDAHRQAAAARPHDWGPVGDLGEAEALLKRALCHVGRMDERQLDAALDAMELIGSGD